MASKYILAVVGLAGAGKSKSTDFIISKTDWARVHFGQSVLDEVKSRGLEINQTNEKLVREQLREKYGMAALAKINIERIRELYKAGTVVVESLYSWEEYKTLKDEFGEVFKVLAIYSSFEVRMSRMLNRDFRPLNEEELNSRDYAEIENLHKAGPIARADFLVINNGSEEELDKALEPIVKHLQS